MIHGVFSVCDAHYTDSSQIDIVRHYLLHLKIPMPDTHIAQLLTGLSQKVQANSALPSDLQRKAYEQISRAALSLQYGGSLGAIDITEKYIDFITRQPWQTRTEDLLDIHRVRQTMDSRHYGLDKVKKRIEEYLASVIMIKKQSPDASLRAPSLFFTGLAGTGKTSFAPIIAESLGRKFYRIPFGGLANALDLRGQSKMTPYAGPGIILRALVECGTRNPVILLDEIDRANPSDRAAIMGALLEILDPGQNNRFTDYYLDYPFDLSQVMFVATANNTKDISTAVLDRLEVVQMPSYTDEEKIEIGKKYVMPKMLAQSGLTTSQLSIDDAVWPRLVRPLGFEPGIRSLERLIESLVRKVTLQIVSGTATTVVINEANMNSFVDVTMSSMTG